MSRLKNYNIMKAAVWYTVGNILIRGVSFFALPLFTGLMSTYDYGVYSVYTSYLSLFETFVLFGLSSTVSLAKFTDGLDDDRYLTTALVIPPLLTLAAGIIINLYLGVNGSLLSMSPILWNFLLVNAAITAVAQIMQARLILDGRYQLYIAYSALTTLGNLGLSALLCFTVFRSHDIYMARVIGNFVASAAGAALLYGCMGFQKRIQRSCFRQAFRWGVPLLFHTLATVVLTQTDRILIQNLDGYSSAGIYGVSVTIIVIPLTLQSSFSSAWQPWFFNELEQKHYPAIRRMNHLYILLFAVITAELCLIAPEVIHIFTNEAYWDSVYSLVPLFISVMGEMLYSIPCSLEYYHKKTTYIMSGTLACTACNIVLDVVFILNFGYIAAAYATMLSKLLLFLFHYLLSRKVDKEHLFQWRYVAGSLVFLGCINLLTVTRVDDLLTRGVLFLAIGLAFLWGVWKNRNDLLTLLRAKQ